MRKLPISGYVINCHSDNYQYLPTCLASLSFCEQKIFISDKAKPEALKLAKDWGWETYEWTGPNDMSARRNYAVGAKGCIWETFPEMKDNHPVIRNEYVMFLDSDEILSPDGFTEIRRALQSESISGFSRFAFILRNLREDGAIISTCPLERMWRRGVKWERSVQNDVVAINDKITLIPVEFFHFGYGDADKHEYKQWKRINHNEEEVSKYPDDIHTRMYLVNALAIAGKHTPLAIDRILAQCNVIFNLFEKSQRTWKEIHALEKTCRFLWNTCMDNGKHHIHAEAEERYYEFTKVNPDSACRLYVSFAEMGDYRKAINYGIKYLAAMKAYRKDKSPYAMEMTMADSEPEVKNGIVKMCNEIINQTQDPKEKKWADKQMKYWSKQ